MLSKNELTDINGGGVSYGVVALAIGGVIFLVGVLDGYVRPLKCKAKIKKKKKK